MKCWVFLADLLLAKKKKNWKSTWVLVAACSTEIAARLLFHVLQSWLVLALFWFWVHDINNFYSCFSLRFSDSDSYIWVSACMYNYFKLFCWACFVANFSFKCCVKISNKKFKPGLLLMVLQQWIGNKRKITAVNKHVYVYTDKLIVCK